ncbi:MAG: YdcH family protein [Syntrophobacterales bacterium]|nr:MAG: YdcH family protein [Syntrophobacterales bacterium]
MVEEEHLSFEVNEELKRIRQRHADLERQLEEYENRPFLTPVDDLEMKKIKKKKLACKDAIERILTHHRRRGKTGNENIG